MVSKNKEYSRIALCCQGGGSLGAYHIGAIKAMIENDYTPDFVSGISIGAFTAAIVAGNDPDKVVSKLEGFWDAISWSEILPNTLKGFLNHRKKNKLSSLRGFIFGQPNFFVPRIPHPSLYKKGSIEATSYYDTKKIYDTLLNYVDFDRINSGKTRLTVGSTRVKDGELVFFDSGKITITPDHIVSSGSMPPGFPGVRIDGELYWDGGCVTNTPLEGILDVDPHLDTLCFMIDLFNPIGKEPTNMEEVQSRAKDIQYTSRTSHHIEQVRAKQNVKRALTQVYKKLPDKMKEDPTVKKIVKHLDSARFDIVHLVYGTPDHEISTKDCEFSKSSIRDRSERGYYNMTQAFAESPWLKEKPDHVGSKIYKFIGGNYLMSH